MFVFLSCVGVFWLNYLRSMRWAGEMNPESSGYMLGGVIISGLLGWFVAFLVNRARGKRLGVPRRR